MRASHLIRHQCIRAPLQLQGCPRGIFVTKRLNRAAIVCSASSVTRRANLTASEAVLSTLRSAEAFAFDVDSTLCQDESIDELAAYLGVGDVVATMTANAMGGTVTFQDALAARLAIMNVSRSALEGFLRDHPPSITPGIPELVELLHSQQRSVFLVSGGFRPIINPVADILNISRDHVFANTILFDEAGNYAGFDAEEYTSRSGGKASAVRHIKEHCGIRSLVMVGDGATDLEARQPGGADLFIGFGGVVERDAVAVAADWYTYRIQQIIEALL